MYACICVCPPEFFSLLLIYFLNRVFNFMTRQHIQIIHEEALSSIIGTKNHVPNFYSDVYLIVYFCQSQNMPHVRKNSQWDFPLLGYITRFQSLFDLRTKSLMVAALLSPKCNHHQNLSFMYVFQIHLLLFRLSEYHSQLWLSF